MGPRMPTSVPYRLASTDARAGLHTAVGQLVVHRERIDDVADIGAEDAVSITGRRDGMNAREPAHDIDVVAVLLNNNVAGMLGIEQPVANFLF